MPIFAEKGPTSIKMKNLGSQLQENFEHALKCKYACWINKEYKLEERNIYIGVRITYIYKKK